MKTDFCSVGFIYDDNTLNPDRQQKEYDRLFGKKKKMKTELLGLKPLQEYTLKCADCGCPLVEIVLIETNEQRQTRHLPPQSNIYQSSCYKCGGHSFNSPSLNGTTVIGPYKQNTRIEHEITTCNGELIFSKLKVVKK